MYDNCYPEPFCFSEFVLYIGFHCCQFFLNLSSPIGREALQFEQPTRIPAILLLQLGYSWFMGDSVLDFTRLSSDFIEKRKLK